MDKKYIFLFFGGLFFFGVARANENTFSIGYTNTKIKYAGGENSELKGFNIKYHRKLKSNIGLIGSFVVTRNEDTQKGYYRDYGIDQNGKWSADQLIYGKSRTDVRKYYSLNIGPTYHFNNQVTVYMIAGITKTDVTTSVHNLTEKYKTSDKFIATTYGAGVQISLLNNWLIDVSCDRMKTGDIEAQSWVLGLGYRF